jgi:hypothetical protein
MPNRNYPRTEEGEEKEDIIQHCSDEELQRVAVCGVAGAMPRERGGWDPRMLRLDGGVTRVHLLERPLLFLEPFGTLDAQRRVA